jgi:hypothetical protein
MVKPAPLFDPSPAETPAAPVDVVLPDRPSATRLRAVLLVALLAVGLADVVVVVRHSTPVRTLDIPEVTPVLTPSPVVLPTLTPPIARPSAAATPRASTRDAADIAFVRRYYALLPGRPGAAFRLLGAQARARSGGYPRFAAFYSGIAAVSIDPAPGVVAPSTVAAVIRFQRRTGEVTHERYEFVVATAPDGRRELRSYRRT